MYAFFYIFVLFICYFCYFAYLNLKNYDLRPYYLFIINANYASNKKREGEIFRICTFKLLFSGNNNCNFYEKLSILFLMNF